ncbi:MAG: hypothetical protein U9R68_01925 [Planctomycetota bacterium]|nr:hypothetical protein [Planctomycetota bacterium]
MRKALLPTLLLLLAAGLIGCEGRSAESPAKKEFQKLYQEYSARFHEKMVGSAQTMKPAQITAEAARIWDAVFAGHQDVVDARIKNILQELGDAEPFNEEMYVEIASGERVQPTDDQPTGIVVKQFLWNPVGAAQMALNNWLARLLGPKAFGLRRLLTANAGLFWKAVSRDIDHPKLQLRQGPMIFTVDLSRQTDFYRVDKVRYLRPKSMGPISITQPEEGDQEPTPPQEGTEQQTPPENGAKEDTQPKPEPAPKKPTG